MAANNRRKGCNMTDSTSSAVTVVGLFRDRGSAENARNRLKTEKLASEDRMVLKVLKETAPLPPRRNSTLYLWTRSSTFWEACGTTTSVSFEMERRLS